jgi:penicillin-binding protein 1A
MNLLRGILGLLSNLGLFAIIALLLAVNKFSAELPDYQQLKEYHPPLVTRVLASDGRLLAEYAIEKRVFVPSSAIPDAVKRAFISAEDKTFYTHPGIDLPGIAAAMLTNIKNYGTGRRPIGASTITQQVAKNFFFSNEATEVSYQRKAKELILAVRLEQSYSKERILELYLNQIYLGQGAYGVVAAALNYFDKTLDELTISEAAYLAGLPKAPNDYHLTLHPMQAKARRDWVIGQMLDNGFITREQADAALAETLQPRARGTTEAVTADYFAEEVRREIATSTDPSLGQHNLYTGGLYIRSTLDPKLQGIADRVLREGLVRYDLRHGWRGTVAEIDPDLAEWDYGQYEGRRSAEIRKPGAEPATIEGSLVSAGNITLAANQIYPTTMAVTNENAPARASTPAPPGRGSIRSNCSTSTLVPGLLRE